MDLPTQIRSALQSQGLPSPSVAWIRTAMPNRNPLPPLPALVATVKTRFLAADLTNPALFDSPSPAFPPNSTNPEIKEVRLTWDIPVQVLDIENLSKSKWDQVEEIEAIARGEQTRGREIIRLPTGDEEDEFGLESQPTRAAVNGAERPGLQGRGGSTASVAAAAAAAGAASKTSTHRLVLQDCKGQKLYGLELKRIDKIGIGTLNIGEKILLKRGAILARGTLLLDPGTCTILGGKIEAWQKDWVESRLARLRAAVGADSPNAR
ncbi:RecQ mediated genome instability protein Rmi1 [Nemania sp. FL0031]|nr:RecQ mediated genome instability protein Rmi1 [Nemania sp. FL0031]